MSLEIDEALREGFDRTFSRNGLLLFVAFSVFNLLNLVLGQSFAEALTPVVEQQLAGAPDPMAEQMSAELDAERPFAIGMPLQLAAGLSLLSVIVAEAMRIASIRVCASDVRDRLPVGEASRRLGIATIYGVVAGIAARIAIGVSALFLLIPGIFVALSLYFVRQEVALADKTVFEALQDSWMLARGNRWELVGLAAVLIVFDLIVTSPEFIIGQFDQTWALLAGNVLRGVTIVFSIAVVTRAYQQLRAERAERLGLDDSADPAESR